MRSASEVKFPVFCIYSSLEAQFFPAVGVLDGDIVPASSIDFQAYFLQRGEYVFPVMDKPLFQFCRHIGMDGFLGFGPLILPRRFAPADQSGPV